MMAVEEIHVTSAEEQRKWLDHMQKQCLQESYNFTFIPEAPTGHCPQIWDGLMCWPATPAGTLFKQPCAHYFLGFNHKANASKYCTLTGEWFQDETNMPWTNYSQCYSESTVSLPVNFTGFTNGNPFISDYVPILKIIAQVGYTVSLIALVIAFSILVTIKKLRCPRNMLHLHLFVSFIMRASMAILKDVTFVSGVGLNQEFIEKNGTSYLLDQNNWICKAVISVWQYSLMANYSWILMEGLYLHNLIFLAVFSDASSILLYIILGWGLPAIFVFLWILARVFLEDILCWTTHTSYLLFLLMIRGPTTLSIILNFLLFLNIVRVLLLKLQASVCEETHTYRRWAKSTLVLVPLFGVHYAIFLGMGIGTQPHLEIAWLFCDQLFASFQGFFVALLYCFMNGEVRSELKRQWPHPGRLCVLRRKGHGRFFRRSSRCYSTTSCTSLSVINTGIGGYLSKKLRQSSNIGVHETKQLPTCPSSDSHYSCAPSARLSSGELSNSIKPFPSHNN